MSPTLEEQIEKLKKTIGEMEAQREALGEAVVQKAIIPLREKLEELNRMLEDSRAKTPEKPIQQRKLLTILFMDIAGSTAIIQHMDPEEVSEAFDRNLKRLAEPVDDYGGRVTSFMGDGFMALFGAPTAREDDPERAVQAGLAILQRAEEIASELEKEWDIHDFKVRVGVNTGLVILGGETEGEDTTKGPAVHLAARLQSAAPSGGLLISHDTYRHIRGVFNVEPWEPIKVKGFDEPVQVYRVLSAKPRAFRAYTRGVEGVETRMVGRQSELKYLQEAYSSAVEDGEEQVVTITGEAGVGKSRLLYEFQNWIELQPTYVRLYEGRAHQDAQGMPLAMMRDLFEFRFQLQENDTLEVVREKVESGFVEVFGAGDEGEMRSHILGQWLGFDFSTSPHLKGALSDPEQLYNQGLMYLTEYFTELCERNPVIVLLEDIHWADDSSLDALNVLGERLQHQRLLFVCAARHSLLERRPYWGEGLAYHHRLDLEPLSKRESHQLVDEIFKLAEKVPAELSELVVEGAEGNPFYVEELVKMLVEDGVVVKGEETWQVSPERLSEVKVPPTLAGVLQARLESLPTDEQQVLQQASVVGRLFWDQVVAHIQAAEGGKPQAVPEKLSSLRSREMVYRREASAFADSREYLFKHDILREVTYESVLKRLRRKYHGLVADWMINQVTGRMGEYSGLIAGHLLQAGRNEQAGEYFLQAGQASLASFSNVEAEGYFRKVLTLSPTDEITAACLFGLGQAVFNQGSKKDAIELLRQGIEVYLKLNNWDGAATVYAARSGMQWIDDYGKAWEVCQEGLYRLKDAPESPGMAQLLAEAGRAAFFMARPYDEVSSLCQRAIDMAGRQGEQRAKVVATITLALYEPDYDTAIQLLKEGAALSEENNLWNPAHRAYTNLGAISTLNFENLQTIEQYYMKAIDVALRSSNLEAVLFTLSDLAECLIGLGLLNSIEKRLTEILRRSTASQARIDELLDDLSPFISYAKGEWTELRDQLRHRVVELRKKKKYQHIVYANLSLANACLELNRFGGMADLSEAETALNENIRITWYLPETWFTQGLVYIRQGRLAEAHEGMNEIARHIHQMYRHTYEVHRLQAEAEFAREERRWDEAIGNCQALIAIYQADAYRWRQARQLIDLGDAFMGRDLPGDRELAEQAYRQSLEMFTEMGAAGYIQVLEKRLGRRKSSDS